MSIVLALLAAIALVNGIYAVRLAMDLVKHRKEAGAEPGNPILLALWGTAVFFLSTFGISDFALSTVAYRARKLVDDKTLPGTLNTQCVLPVAVMALAYISAISVDPLTLIVCILAQMAGAFLGPRFVVKLPAKAIRVFMGVGLLVATFFILAGKFHLIASGGEATGLAGGKLAIAALLLFVFGALNNIGIGSYAPTMAAVYALGISPAVAFPIMMGACTFSVPMGSLEFVRLGSYGRKITFFSSVFGIAGVLAAVFIVKSLNVAALQWVIAAVILYSGASMLVSEFLRKGTAAKAGA
ncbi:MAG TPA: sulfite exporter TauE/SafE family protein [Spirochaetales bacterium]|nr:sulfite exporter TauE/SafE family protein [Spirochaetales bacterium]HRY53957.1 sulfite exporter TauE/SafE family protein [Spirochaetia bacterium]HRZ64131.1 sulfite exporter TauE/SafE family protein [Spirochaetia bacterium]